MPTEIEGIERAGVICAGHKRTDFSPQNAAQLRTVKIIHVNVHVNVCYSSAHIQG